MSGSKSGFLSIFMACAAVAAIGLFAILTTADGALAFSHGGGMVSRPGPGTTGVAPNASHVVLHGPMGPAQPLAKKLSGRGVVKCIRACMHGVDASWAEFCEYSCAGP